MAKLNQLLLLEQMFQAYDSLNINDKCVIQLQGMCIERLVDDINGRLERLVVSKVRMSCRNVLLANYETMTKTTYWLGCRLFSDLPQGESRVIREKVEQMVELLNELVLKIVNVDEDFAATFFRKLKEGYGRRRNTQYELWKLQQTEVTMERLTEYQVQITADLLMMGVLRYDRAPTDGELEQVQLEKVQRKLSHDKELPEWFRAECAKLRRYSHWEGDMFFIDYEKLRKYLFHHFGEMTNEQHIAMFEYDVQMKQIREEIKKYQKPLPIKDKEMNNTIEEMKKETGGFHVHVYSTGNNIAQTINQTINGNVYYGQNVTEKPKATDEQVAQALTNIVGKGKPIDSKQKWTGALWMLHWMCGYPIKAQEFCTRIEQLPLPSDLEFKCDYRNIRELATLSFISQDATQMDKVVPSKNDTPVFQQMRTVALAVAQELRAVTGQHD